MKQAIPSIISPIQNQIISRLKNAKALSYADLAPEKVPNDLFNYHLQFLVKKGYLKKEDDGYSLSELGVKHVADFNPAGSDGVRADLFKINVMTIVSRMHEGMLEILNQFRTSNPAYGKVGVMGGVVRKGESTEAAAKRKLKAETGLDADFKVVGMQRRMLYAKGELFSDVLFPIAYSDECDGDLLPETEYGRNMWVGIDEAIQNELSGPSTISALPDVLRSIKSGNILKSAFFYDEDIQSNELV